MKHRAVLALVGAITLLTLFSPVNADDSGEDRYPKVTDAEAVGLKLAEARQAALEQGKLLMIVLGANWCHDSRAFADYLEASALSTLVDQRYVVERVNVGFYETIRGVVDRWDIPIIYGTPTVLVIEPHSNRLLNRDSLAYWRNADALGASAAVAYFEDFQPGTPVPPDETSARLAKALADIDHFEHEQAERLYVAYADLGERLRAMGDDAPDAAFRERWDNVAAMRSKITVDLAELRREAHTQDQVGIDPIRLTFPDYDLYTD